MSKYELSKFDTVKAVVYGRAKNNGYYLKIKDLEEDVIAMVYDCALLVGWEVIVSISKISENRNYILAKLDSVCGCDAAYSCDTYYEAA